MSKIIVDTETQNTVVLFKRERPGFGVELTLFVETETREYVGCDFAGATASVVLMYVDMGQPGDDQTDEVNKVKKLFVVHGHMDEFDALLERARRAAERFVKFYLTEWLEMKEDELLCLVEG